MPATKPNVAALVEQMPETDKDIQAKQDEEKKAAQADVTEKPKPQPAPNPGSAASKFTGPAPEAAEKIFGEILGGGRDSIVELIALLREPGDSDYKNYKAGYVLHGLCLLAGRAGQEDHRRLMAEALASQLANGQHSIAVKQCLIRELQVIGGKEVVSALGKHLLDADLGESAVRALLAIRDGTTAQFRKALGQAKGRNRVAIIQALGVLQDSDSAGVLRKLVTDEDRDVRRTSAWALANLGDADAAGALIKLADGSTGWERTHATGICLLLAEKLEAAGKKTQAVRIYAHLRDTRKDPADRNVREVAEKALGGSSKGSLDLR